MNQRIKHGPFWTGLFSVISLAWLFPLALVLINSFKKKVYISADTFSLPTGKEFAGLFNYKDGIEKTNFIASFGWSLVITVGAVLLILLCTSMCAWWIVRVNNVASKIIYVLFLLNMIVPFQMVMFPLSKMADMLGLNTPWGVCLVYLGFGAGLPVFIFTGTIKSIPQEIEESAMIDGAGAVRTFFTIVVPMMRSSIITVAILQTMWIWNDSLLPYLGSAKVQDHSNRDPVSAWRLRQYRYGRPDGMPGAGDYSNRHLLRTMPEVHHPRHHRRCGEGLIQYEHSVR